MSQVSDLRQRDIKPEVGNGSISKGQENTSTYRQKDTKERITQGKLDQIQETCTVCCIPCLTSHNPLPENPSLFQRFKHGLMLPLHGNLATYIQFSVVCLQLWIVLYSLTHGLAMPGGNFFSLLILFIVCAIGGYFISLIRLPPLLGMLIVGVLLRNVPGVQIVGENIDGKWSKALRKIALTVILTRAGLGLDIVKLRKLSWAVLRLAFLPCTAEIITVGIVSHFILGFPWKWSLMLGCILGALSPAVTVPALVNLQDRKYGVAKGIPTMLLAAGGLDNVLCVTGFSVFMGIIFSEGDLAVTILKGPLGVFVGIVYGFVAGIFLWYIPSKDCANKVFYRTLMLFGFGMIAVFGSSEINLSGAGPLGCLTTATVAGYKWRQRRKPGEQDEVSGVMALIWLIAQHFLFGLIGAAVNISNIQSSTAGWGILTLAIGLIIRSAVDFTVTLRTGFNLKERVFITLTWLSKATVQAAIGGLPLAHVTDLPNPSEESKQYATDILTLSVLAIVICAPTGATLMAILGPKFLVKGETTEDSIEVCTDNDAGDNTTVQMFDLTQVHKESTNKTGQIQIEPVIQPDKKHTLEFQKIGENDIGESFSDPDSGRDSGVPELYKSQLSVTLSTSDKNETESIIHSNMVKDEMCMGFDNPVFEQFERLSKNNEQNEKQHDNIEVANTQVGVTGAIDKQVDNTQVDDTGEIGKQVADAEEDEKRVDNTHVTDTDQQNDTEILDKGSEEQETIVIDSDTHTDIYKSALVDEIISIGTSRF